MEEYVKSGSNLQPHNTLDSWVRPNINNQIFTLSPPPSPPPFCEAAFANIITYSRTIAFILSSFVFKGSLFILKKHFFTTTTIPIFLNRKYVEFL